METDFVFVILMAAFAFGPAVTVLIVTTWCKMDQKKDGAKKEKKLPCLSTAPKVDTRTECPKCGKKAHRKVIRTYKQKGVARWRFYKCMERDEDGSICNQPFRQGDFFDK